jgi:DNA polymerase III subunit chi
VTEITFHFNVRDRTAYACRLLRKATRRQARIAVTADDETLATLDRQLWEFDPAEFLPHVRVRAGQDVPMRMRATPIWLVDAPTGIDGHDVLVNLGAGTPLGFESYAKLIEIVSTGEDERSAARLRWRHYAHRGYPIVRHEAAE